MCTPSWIADVKQETGNFGSGVRRLWVLVAVLVLTAILLHNTEIAWMRWLWPWFNLGTGLLGWPCVLRLVGDRKWA